MKTKVISCCGKRHINIFSHGSSFIKENIKADSYEVFIRADTVDMINAPGWIITNEDKIDNSPILDCKYYWMKQQLLKIYGAYTAALQGYERLIIWDGDTIPLKPISFFEDDKVNYVKAGEHHAPYFETIKMLLNLEKEVKFSFISQCFALKGEWIKNFIQYIEQKHNKPWWKAILAIRQTRGFSEYESLGTYINKYHSEEMNYINIKWSRSSLLPNEIILGKEFTKHLKQLASERPDLSYATFELWDKVKLDQN